MHKKTKILSLVVFLITCFPLLAQSSLDNKAKDKQDALLQKDKANREKILAKYYQFYSKLKDRYPGLNFEELPVDPSLARDVIEHNESPGGQTKKAKSIFAYSSEAYLLKSEPSVIPKFNTDTKLSRGEKIEVVLVLKNDGPEKKDQPNWCLVRTNSKKEGYIPSEYLSSVAISKEDSPEKKLASLKPPSTRAFAFPENLKISKKSRAAEQPFFDPVTGEMTENVPEFTEIPGKEQISVTETVNLEPEPKTTDKLKGKFFWVNAGSLNVRENPEVNSYIVDRLTKGIKITVIQSTNYEDNIDGISSAWHQVENGYQKGWVFGGYLSSSEVQSYDSSSNSDFPSFPEENPDELKPGEKRYVRAASLRLRDEPNEYGTVIASIAGDEKLKIIDAKNEIETIGGTRSKWIYVNWDDQWEGWVFGGFVSKDKGQLVDNDDISKYFQIPIDNDRYVSSNFGTRVDPVTGKVGAFHSGVDLPAPVGTAIRAVSDGKVWKTITTAGGYGVLTILSHKNNVYTYYAHQNQRKIAEGDVVRSGDVIGEVGNTGKSTGPHLHFEVRKGPQQQALDPGAYLPK
ncbi:peptidoglycan DD-metalloendopeptidase family protein [Leptospira ilyithenensis]|nr:peptidoglycan DD-metalloendopeptidase family protein [Leptospira ilyithenensis]